MTGLTIAPLLLPLLTGIGLLLLRRWLRIETRRALGLAAVLAQVPLALALLIAVGSGDILTYRVGDWPPPYGIVLVADRLAAWMLLITALLALFALLPALRGTDREGRHFHPLFQLQLFGLNGAFLTGDIFNLFVFFEVLLIASYGLLMHGGGAERVRSGLHFVVLNLVGSALFLFAAGTLYGVLGTLNMADLAVRVATVAPADIGLVRTAGLLLLGVFALKAALVPLHLWLPGAYAATSAPVAALFAIMTKVGAYGLLRVGTLVFGGDAGALAGLYADWLLPLGLISLWVGAFGVLSADGLRRQVAYLVVVSVGLLMTAFGLASAATIAAGLYYLASTTFATGAFFLLADLIARERGARGDALTAGAGLARPGLLGGLFFVCALLVVGLPPFSGFIGKLLVLRGALDDPSWAWVLATVLGAGLLGLIALARSGSTLFFGAGSAAPGVEPGPRGDWLPALGLIALCLGLTLLAGPISALCGEIAEQLLRPQTYIEAVLAAPQTRTTP